MEISSAPEFLKHDWTDIGATEFDVGVQAPLAAAVAQDGSRMRTRSSIANSTPEPRSPEGAARIRLAPSNEKIAEVEAMNPGFKIPAGDVYPEVIALL